MLIISKPGVNYLESLTKPNVMVVYGEIDRITPTSVISREGAEHEIVVLVCATGKVQVSIPNRWKRWKPHRCLEYGTM
jgi:hypothetical protein